MFENKEYAIGLFRNLTILEDLTYNKEKEEFCTLEKAWEFCLDKVLLGYESQDALDMACDKYDLSFRHYEALCNLSTLLDIAMQKLCGYNGGML